MNIPYKQISPKARYRLEKLEKGVNKILGFLGRADLESNVGKLMQEAQESTGVKIRHNYEE